METETTASAWWEMPRPFFIFYFLYDFWLQVLNKFLTFVGFRKLIQEHLFLDQSVIVFDAVIFDIVYTYPTKKIILMTRRDSIDPDITSKSQVYRALRRAESDYGSYSRRANVTRQRKITENWLENERFRSRTAFATARISRSDYVRVMKDARTVANKEIKSSVSRSRRWSGKDVKPINNQAYSRTTLANRFHHTKPCANGTETIAKDEKQKCLSLEADYHKTVCDILTNKGASSSYGHVAKMLSQKANKKVHFDTKLPKVYHNYENQVNREESSKNSSRKRLDVTLPSVLRNEVKDLQENECPVVNRWVLSTNGEQEDHFEESSQSNELNTRLPLGLKPLPFYEVCHVLPDDEFDSLRKRKERASWMTLLKKKQAHRAITGYYNKKQRISEEHPKMVIIHLPNPNPSLESRSNSKRAPRLQLR